MNQNEQVEFLANALVSEMARAYLSGGGEASASARLEMSLSELVPQFKQFFSERFQQNAAGKNFFGVAATGVRFLLAQKEIEKHLLRLIDWAGNLAGDKIQSATREDLQRYALYHIKFSSAVTSVAQDLFLEKRL